MLGWMIRDHSYVELDELFPFDYTCVVWSLDCKAMADTRFMEGKYIIGQQ